MRGRLNIKNNLMGSESSKQKGSGEDPTDNKNSPAEGEVQGSPTQANSNPIEITSEENQIRASWGRHRSVTIAQQKSSPEQSDQPNGKNISVGFNKPNSSIIRSSSPRGPILGKKVKRKDRTKLFMLEKMEPKFPLGQYEDPLINQAKSVTITATNTNQVQAAALHTQFEEIQAVKSRSPTNRNNNRVESSPTQAPSVFGRFSSYFHQQKSEEEGSLGKVNQSERNDALELDGLIEDGVSEGGISNEGEVKFSDSISTGSGKIQDDFITPSKRRTSEFSLAQSTRLTSPRNQPLKAVQVSQKRPSLAQSQLEESEPLSPLFLVQEPLAESQFQIKQKMAKKISQEPKVYKKAKGIVFNQEKTQLAILWKADQGPGGFSKFDSSSLAVVQRFPEALTLREQGQEINCLALIHKTKSFVLVHEDDPKVVKHYDNSTSTPRCFYFEEDVAAISVLSGASYTIIACETKIYIYKRNGQDLYNIIDCFKPQLSAAMLPLIDPSSILVAYLEPENEENKIQLFYSGQGGGLLSTQIKQPFGRYLKVGRMELTTASQEHQHQVSLVVISEDGLYINIYALKDLLENIEFNEDTDYISKINAQLADSQFEAAFSSNKMTVTEEIKTEESQSGGAKPQIQFLEPMQKFQRGYRGDLQKSHPFDFFNTQCVDACDDFSFFTVSTKDETAGFIYKKTEQLTNQKESRNIFQKMFEASVPTVYQTLSFKMSEELLVDKNDQQSVDDVKAEYVCFWDESSSQVTIITLTGQCFIYALQVQKPALVDRKTPKFFGLDNKKANFSGESLVKPETCNFQLQRRMLSRLPEFVIDKKAESSRRIEFQNKQNQQMKQAQIEEQQMIVEQTISKQTGPNSGRLILTMERASISADLAAWDSKTAELVIDLEQELTQQNYTKTLAAESNEDPGQQYEPVWEQTPFIIHVSDCNLNMRITFFEKGSIEQKIMGESIIRPQQFSKRENAPKIIKMIDASYNTTAKLFLKGMWIPNHK